MTTIERAIRSVGSMSELARRLELDYQTVQYWRKKGIPPSRWWRRVEAATDGKVRHSEFLLDID